MLALLTLITTVFAADCPESLTRDALSQRLDRATASYRDLDSDGFFVAMASVEADLPCTDSVLLPSEVARLHRLWGVTLYSRDGVLTAMPAFQAANRVDPEGSLPSDLVPEGHELWQLSRQIGRGDEVGHGAVVQTRFVRRIEDESLVPNFSDSSSYHFFHGQADH